MEPTEPQQPPTDGGHGPVGRVLLEPEEPSWEDAQAVSTPPEGRWTPPFILLALVLIAVMVAVMVLLLWGVFQTAPA
jgi:hypothetical protein